MCCCCCLVTELCLTLCDPMDCRPPGSAVHGISQARRLELPFPSSRDLPDTGIKPMSPALAGAGRRWQVRSLLLSREGSPEDVYWYLIGSGISLMAYDVVPLLYPFPVKKNHRFLSHSGSSVSS